MWVFLHGKNRIFLGYLRLGYASIRLPKCAVTIQVTNNIPIYDVEIKSATGDVTLFHLKFATQQKHLPVFLRCGSKNVGFFISGSG